MRPTAEGEILHRRCVHAFRFLTEAAAKGRPVLGERRIRQVRTRHLRALIAVAKRRSYAAAARESGVSQPVLYRAAKDLEAVCGVPLFQRSGSGLELTSPARALHQSASLAFAELDQARDELAEHLKRSGGALRVGSLPLALGAILPDAITEMSKMRPDLRVSIASTPYEQLLEALRYGEIDIMLGALRDPPPASDIAQEALFDDRVGVFAGPGHPLLEADAPDRETLGSYPWIVAPGVTQTRRRFDDFFAGLAPVVDGPAVETNSLAAARRLLGGDRLLALLSVTLAEESLRAGAIQRVPVELDDAPRPIGLTTRRNWRPTRAQADFLAILRKSVTRLAPPQC